MKKFLIIIFVLIIGISCSREEVKEEQINYPYSIETSEISNCNNERVLLYDDQDNNIKYYSYCLNDFKIITESNTYNLESAFNNGIVFSDILKYLSNEIAYNDGGTTVYIDDKHDGYTNNGIRIVTCHRIKDTDDYIDDVYILPSNMEYNDLICL